MTSFTDQLGNRITLPSKPRRIVSLVPSQTELLCHLGLDKEVIGITKFCVHPDDWFRNKSRVGGTKTVHADKVRDLLPDLILANKEENIKEQVEALRQIAPVWTSDINTLDDALQMIRSIGEVTGRARQARALCEEISNGFGSLALPSPPRQAAYLIWKEPYMTIGGDTFISDMMQRCGFSNVFGGLQRYPEVTLSDLEYSPAEYILLSSEPYPFKEKHQDELQSLLPEKKILLVDGEMFSWYGSRLRYAAGYFREVMECLNV